MRRIPLYLCLSNNCYISARTFCDDPDKWLVQLRKSKRNAEFVLWAKRQAGRRLALNDDQPLTVKPITLPLEQWEWVVMKATGFRIEFDRPCRCEDTRADKLRRMTIENGCTPAEAAVAAAKLAEM